MLSALVRSRNQQSRKAKCANASMAFGNFAGAYSADQSAAGVRATALSPRLTIVRLPSFWLGMPEEPPATSSPKRPCSATAAISRTGAWPRPRAMSD
jgi:hypothetical protein